MHRASDPMHRIIMPRTTATIPDDLDEWVASNVEDSDRFDSKADVMRESIRVMRRLDDADASVEDLVAAQERVDELERELEVTENKLQEARDQMKHREQIEEKVDVLAKRVEERERAADAPFPVRWWRWLRSRDGDANGSDTVESTG